MGKFRIYLPCILAAILIGTSYIPFYPWALPFCLAPLFIFILADNRTAKQVFVGTWITFLLGCAIGFFWLPGAVQNYSASGHTCDFLVYFLYIGLSTLPLALAAALCMSLGKTKRDKIYLSFIVPLGFYVCQVYIPVIFQWNLGYPWFFAGSPVFQLTKLMGINGVSLLTYWSSSFLALIIHRRRNIVAHVIVLILLWMALYGAGIWLKHRVRNANEALQILIVQPNVTTKQDLDLELGSGQRKIFAELLALTERGLNRYPSAQFVAWPETALPAFPQSGGEMVGQLTAFIRQMKRPLLTGAYAGRPGREQNAVFYFNRNGGLQEPPYSKVKTFPLAENAFVKGSQLRTNDGIFDYQNVKLGVDICYEGLFSAIARQRVKNGAQIVLNFTDDSWFNSNFEAKQNFYMTLARAVEIGRPILRISNSGITGTALPNGLIHISLGYKTRGYALVRVPISPPHPFDFWIRYGNLIHRLILLLFCFTLAIAAVIPAVKRRRGGNVSF